ncbi:Glu/Leu/Phe/Val dehydrogenase [Candidatus Uhrbacteria bacterium]|nr:Glu/Leu/Phe/Val dehydrogenase [Candidatus Uhrbacteria bacterium]
MSAFDNALRQLSRAQAVFPFEESFIEKLKTPNHIHEKNVMIDRDDGSKMDIEVYRVQHNNARGPYKGGIRFHQQTDLQEVKALALWMAIKTAVVNIPMGGGKGGATVDPKTLSKTELERLSRAWVRAFVDEIGPQKDVPAPDVNTTPQIMDWMTDEYQKLTGDKTGATFTGKSVAHGGSLGRDRATALGGWFVFETLAQRLGLLGSIKVVIQGFGNAGATAAKIWSEHGHKIIAVSDSRGGIVNEGGLDIKAVEAWKEKTGKAEGFPGSRAVSNEALLELPCDLLIPAALENQILEHNALQIGAKVILELANGPTSPEADDILFDRGIAVIPDILANAGGVTVSTFEWEQNLKGEKWSVEDVESRLKKIMTEQAEDVYRLSQEFGTDLRRAAFVLALRRINEAIK